MLQLSQEIFRLLFYSGSEFQRDISAKRVRGQKTEEHVVTDLDVQNDDSGTSL